jgi:hypothetical protein
MSDADYGIVKETGEARDIRAVQPKELQSLNKGLYKEYDLHRSQHGEGFNPPAQRVDETLRTMERGYKNWAAYVRFLRDRDEDVPSTVMAALKRYEDWWDKGGDALCAAPDPSGAQEGSVAGMKTLPRMSTPGRSLPNRANPGTTTEETAIHGRVRAD